VPITYSRVKGLSGIKKRALMQKAPKQKDDKIKQIQPENSN
jgi:hypothetical protein